MKSDVDCRAYFNGLADGWDAKGVPRPELLRAVAFLCGAGPGLRVLDVACGTGAMFPALLEQGVESLLGVDISDSMVSLARLKFGSNPRVRVLCGDFLALAEAPFDAVLLYNAYPHFLDKKALLAKAASLLLPGGRFTIAHDMGRDDLNAYHSGAPSSVSAPLSPAFREARAWNPWFVVDMLCDNPGFYLISGVKR